MHWRVKEQMIFPRPFTADKETEFSEPDSTNPAEFFLNALFNFLKVNNPKIRLPINPHLSERHRIVAVSLQMG